MSGWTHRRTIADGAEVAVGASDTVLLSVATSPLTLASGIISNLDGVDSLTVHWQTSWRADFSDSAEVEALNATQFSEPIGPGESRHFQFDAGALRNFRALARSTGDGATARVFFELAIGVQTR